MQKAEEILRVRFGMSPAASLSAFLQSIMGASVRSRSSLTMEAVISAICKLLFSVLKNAPACGAS